MCTDLQQGVHVDGETDRGQFVQVGRSVCMGHLLQQELEAGPCVKVPRDTVRVPQTAQEGVDTAGRQTAQHAWPTHTSN